MKILVGNNHLAKTGGTENYTYTLAVELKRKGLDVQYFTFEKGEVSALLEQAGIPFMSQNQYDLILANHNTVVEKLWTYGFIIQTCHGTIPTLEQPSPYADMYVTISEEVRDYILGLGSESTVIPNGIDCNRFFPKKPVSPTLTAVLSLCQSNEANEFIRKCCEKMNIKFILSNKYTDNVWAVEDMINQSDLVVGLGRSAYDAMACGRCALSYDYREYMGEFLGDGLLTPENIEKSMYCNCSGRSSRLQYDEQTFCDEMQKYSPELASWSREFALLHLNIEVAVEKYLEIYRNKDNKPYEYALKARLKHLLEELSVKEEAVKAEKQQMHNKLLSMQHQLDEVQATCNARAKKHLRAIRVLLWLCIGMIILLVTLAIVR